MVVARGVGDGERLVAADLGRLVEDRPHPLVGRERLALLDPDLRQLRGLIEADRVGGLVLDHRREVLEVADVGRVDRVEGQARAVDVPRRGGIAAAGQRRDAGAPQGFEGRSRIAARVP